MPKRRRLSRSGEFDRVYRDGSSHATRYLVLYSFPRRGEDGEDSEIRLGVSASRKVGGAVERNRVKRVLREAFWEASDRLPQGHDFVLVARPEIGELIEREGLGGAQTSLDEALAEAGSPRSVPRETPSAGALDAYRRLVSPALPRRCKYEPTCSAYAAESIRRFGAARGLLLPAGACSAATRSATAASTRCRAISP